MTNPSDTPKRASKIWGAIPSLGLLFTGLYLSITGKWSLIPWVPVGPGPFMDLVALTSTAECLRTSGWTLDSPSCDPYDRKFNYPSLWVYVFALFRLDAADTSWLGVAFLVLLCLVVLALGSGMRTSGARPADYLWLSIATVSPAVLFAVERGNVDILILALVLLATLAQIHRFSGTAGFLVGIATLLKLFPIGSSGLLLVGRGRGIRGWIGLFATLAVGTILLVPELRAIGGRTPSGDLVSYGMSVPIRWAYQWLDIQPHPLALRLLGLALFLIFLAVISIVALRWSPLRGQLATSANYMLHRPQAAGLFVASGGAWLVSYATDSFDYKMIFLLPVLAVLLPMAHESWLPRILSVAIVLEMWLSSLMPAPLQVVGDLVWLVTTPMLVILYLTLLWRLLQDRLVEFREGRRADYPSVTG